MSYAPLLDFGDAARLQALVPGSKQVVEVPLVNVYAKAAILDVYAKITISQKFRNPHKQAVDGNYAFPVLARSSICAFDMIRQDGTKVTGLVKEKDEARRTYDDAVEAGKTSALGEEQTKDRFALNVGNIQAGETVDIRITLVQELVDDERPNQIRFHLPRQWAMRYGQSPTQQAHIGGQSASSFRCEVTIQQAAPIKAVSCPSGQPIELRLGSSAESGASIPESHLAGVVYTSKNDLLDKDFVLVISAGQLDRPRAFAEPHPSPSHLTTAMSLTFVPRFSVPDVQGGSEFIFLVDRSGSMQGRAIKLVKEALIVLLRGLPTKGTTFNVFSFGSDHSSLWPRSHPYTQESLDEATKHIDSMDADYGGTEVANALEAVFASVAPTRPCNVLVLTDGGAYDIEGCVTKTRKACSRTGPFMRCLTVGIGRGVSTEMCDAIARAGGGVSVYVEDNEPMTGKCTRLVRAARTPPVKDLTVHWTGGGEDRHDDDFELVDAPPASCEPAVPMGGDKSAPQAVNLFDPSTDSEDQSTGTGPAAQLKVPPLPAPPLQEAPARPVGLFPGTRSSMYAILDNSWLAKGSIPSTITITGVVSTTGAKVGLEVPVTWSTATISDDFSETPSLLHTLSAKALISDLENDDYAFSPSLETRFSFDPQLRSAHVRAETARIGTTYGLTSRHTSFIAVDERDQNRPVSAYEPNGFPRSGGDARGRTSFGGGLGSLHMRAAMAPMMSPHAVFPPPSGLAFGGLGSSDGAHAAAASAPAALLSAMSSRSFRSAPAQASAFGSSTLSGGESFAPITTELYSAEAVDAVQAESASNPIVVFARLQAFDGHFELGGPLLSALTISREDIARTLANDGLAIDGIEDVVATAMAILSLSNTADKEESRDMMDKAQQWMHDVLAGSDIVRASLMKSLAKVIDQSA